MGNGKTSASFRRTRFLARTVMSSPAVVLVYSPLLVAQTIAGIAVPFATGRSIDALVGGISPSGLFTPTGPFAALATLMLVRATLAPCLQRLVASRARNIDAKASHSVRKRSDDSFSSLFDFFRSLPFLRTLDAFRRIIGIVFQDSLFVTGTIRDRLYKPQIRQVAPIAECSQVFSRRTMAFLPRRAARRTETRQMGRQDNDSNANRQEQDFFSERGQPLRTRPFLSLVCTGAD